MTSPYQSLLPTWQAYVLHFVLLPRSNPTSLCCLFGTKFFSFALFTIHGAVELMHIPCQTSAVSASASSISCAIELLLHKWRSAMLRRVVNIGGLLILLGTNITPSCRVYLASCLPLPFRSLCLLFYGAFAHPTFLLFRFFYPEINSLRWAPSDVKYELHTICMYVRVRWNNKPFEPEPLVILLSSTDAHLPTSQSTRDSFSSVDNLVADPIAFR
jgi:hypothetical protein